MPTPTFKKKKPVAAQDRRAALQTLVNFIEAHDTVSLHAVAARLNADPTKLLALVRASVVMLGAAAGDPHMKARHREGEKKWRAMEREARHGE